MSFRGKGTGRALLPFGLDYSDVLSTNFDVEKPKLILPINAPLSSKEKDEAIQSINFSLLVLDGPFYTGNSTDDKLKTTSQTHSDGIERHSDKYKKVKKIGSTIEDHPYNLDLFPQELHPVMGVSKKKKIGVSSYKSTNEMNNGISGHMFMEENDDKSKLVLEQLKEMADDLDVKEEEELILEDDEDEVEDEFEDDEDDDYNAEKYFDDGIDDYGDAGDDEAAF